MEKGWQICPKCEGTGKNINPIISSDILAVLFNSTLDMPYVYKDENGNLKMQKRENICKICSGKMIISTKTGKPPQD